jgi:hypothetical protein
VRQAEFETARERAASYEKHFQNASRRISHTKAAKEHLDAVQADTVAQLSEAAATHHSVRICDGNVDNIETLYRLRHVSGRPADYT